MRAALRMSPPTGQCIAEVRLAMMERGFALVHTPRSFDAWLFRGLKRRMTVLPCHSERWQQFPQLAHYAHWLESLLDEALPDERLSLTSLELRQELAGSADAEVDRLHADGSYLRAVYTLYGQATIYRDAGAEQPVPRGQTLLMTALDRARALRVRCTLHRRPGAGPERALIVCSFEPRQEQS